jgi:hypothetical protein
VAYSLFDDVVEWKPFAKLGSLFNRRRPQPPAEQEEPAPV